MSGFGKSFTRRGDGNVVKLAKSPMGMKVLLYQHGII
jgi:hypothetical protein